MDFIRLIAVAYIYQHAICGYAGHMTVRLSTRMGTAGQGSIWTNTSSDQQGVGFLSRTVELLSKRCVKINTKKVHTRLSMPARRKRFF